MCDAFVQLSKQDLRQLLSWDVASLRRYAAYQLPGGLLLMHNAVTVCLCLIPLPLHPLHSIQPVCSGHPRLLFFVPPTRDDQAISVYPTCGPNSVHSWRSVPRYSPTSHTSAALAPQVTMPDPWASTDTDHILYSSPIMAESPLSCVTSLSTY